MCLALALTRCLDSAVLFLPPAANPEVACCTIPSPTRHASAAIHPRLFAGGDSHRSQGFRYPWKPYAPPRIPAMFLPPAAARTSRGCVGGMWRGHGSWGKETPGYGADRLRRKRAGGGRLNRAGVPQIPHFLFRIGEMCHAPYRLPRSGATATTENTGKYEVLQKPPQSLDTDVQQGYAKRLRAALAEPGK